MANDTIRNLEMFFPYRLAIAAEGFSRSLAAVYGRHFGLSREEWRLLFLLAGEVDGATSLELGRRSTLDKVQVSRASQRLERKGLVTRQIAPNDRRLRLYACTDRGRALFEEVLPQVEARSVEILEALDPGERAALEHGVAALTRALAGPRDHV